MRTPSPTELLRVWERGLAQSPAQRALTLLNACCSEMASEQIDHFSVVERDLLLLALRERIFGPHLASLTTCPACSERLEFSIDVADIRAASKANTQGTFSMPLADYRVQFRLPNSLDLASLDPASDEGASRRHLLQRCVIAAQRGATEIEAIELPQEVLTPLAERMAELDPDSDLQLALSCPLCHHQWQAPLDIVSYFWSEIHAWANRILHEVHTLASAYGWRESDVLGLSAKRRQAYLEMIGP